MNDEEEASTTTPPLSYRDSLNMLTSLPTNEKASSSLRRIFSTIRRYEEGSFVTDESWISFDVNANERTKLERQLLENDFCQNKLRWGYFPLCNQFVIRMPTPVHERFLVRIHDEIRRQLATFANGPSAAFAKDIQFAGSTTYVPSDLEYGRHDPDGSFRHSEERFPGVVIEAAYSQKGKMLGRLAEDYILGSNLKVRVMVGCEISQKKEAKLSVWRPQWRGEAWCIDSEDTIIRHADGKPNEVPEAGLLLHLRDFASVGFCKKFCKELCEDSCKEPCKGIDGTIFVSCKSLCEYLIEAETAMRVILAPESPGPVLSKRRRPPTPEEELHTGDERNIVQVERQESKRVELEDSSYKDSSSIARDSG